MNLWTSVSNIVYPPACAACDQLLGEADEGLCTTCQLSVVDLGAACPRCAEPLAGERLVTCARCRDAPPAFETLVARYRYGGQLAEALRMLKFDNRPDIARTLAPLISPMLHATAALCDVVVPVPLHPKRHLARGFNQAELLTRFCRPTATIDTWSLRRDRATPAQSGLDARQRAANLAGAFSVRGWRRKRVRQRHILLVDDVVTTGATMNAAASALLAAGAAAVFGFCVARAEF